MSNTTKKYKGIDILYDTNQDLEVWATPMCLLFQIDGLEEFISEEVKVEPDPNADPIVAAMQEKVMRKKHAQFELIIMQHIGGVVKSLYQRKLIEMRGNVKKANGFQAWTALYQVFQGAGSTNKHLWLTRLFDFKMPSTASRSGLTKGLQDFENICSKLRELNVNMDEDMLGIKLANSLPKNDTSCRIVYTNAMQMKSPTVKMVVDDIEQLITQFACDEYSPTDGDEKALTVKERNARKWCAICKKHGWHTEEKCYKNPKNKQGGGAKGDEKDKGLYKHIDAAIEAFIVAQSSKAKKKQKKTEIPEEDAFYADVESSNSDNSCSTDYPFEQVNFTSIQAFLTSSSCSKGDWIADSGATSHMTSSSTHMYNITRTLGVRVRVGNGNELDILCKGSMDFISKNGNRVTLYNVMYVPGLTCNLVSIGRLQRRGLTTTFPGSSATPTLHAFIKNKRGQRFLSATLDRSLYKVDMERTKSPLYHQAYPATTMEILHQRLGHIPFRKIKEMAPMLKKQKITIANKTSTCSADPCYGCALGKLTRGNVNKHRTHPATEALEVIHTDISGPYKKTSSANRWLIIFVDEFTRHTTSYPLKTKSEALATFQKYKAFIENDRKATIKSMSMSPTARDTIMRLQSDGGGEYKSSAFAFFLETAGIQHYTTNADNPAQNGIAERYIRSVTETGMSMLKHARLSGEFWPYAMRTAVYLLNRIPKSILDNTSPYEMWTGTVPNLRFLRTFGVDAHVRTVTQNRRKGGDKSHPCTFLGYREGLKGYVFQDKRTKRIINNGDATFYEGDWIVNGVKRFDFTTKPEKQKEPPSPEEPKDFNSDFSSDDDSSDDGKQQPTEPTLVSPTEPVAELSPTSLIPHPLIQTETARTTQEPRTLSSVMFFNDSAPTNAVSPQHEKILSDTTPDSSFSSPTNVPNSSSDIGPEIGPPPVTKTLPRAPTSLERSIANEITAEAKNTRRTLQFAPEEKVLSPPTLTSRNPLNTRPRRALSIYQKKYNEKQKRRQTPSPPPAENPKRRKQRKQKERKRGRNPQSPPRSTPPRRHKTNPRDHIPELALSVQAVHHDGILVPTTLKAALNSPQKDLWKEAMEEELRSLASNDVLGPILYKLPLGRKGISSRWVFAIKRDERGNIARYKARLVAKGFTQRHGIDYDRTFAPVMKQSLLRAVLAEANFEDWDIEQVDIKTAFLYGELDETIFLKLPDGSLHQLQRALYGLKQAGRQWYSRFNKSLEAFGLKRLHGDPCCYHKRTETETLIVMVHVDDAIITGTKPESIRALKTALRKEYELKDLGPIKHCLGWEVSRNRQRRLLTINQRQYIIDLLRTYDVKTKTKSVPASDITLRPTGPHESKLDKPYMELLGAVLYIANSTRPDLSYAVSELSRYSSNPSITHWNELNRILYYLNETQSHGLVFRGTQSPIIHGFVDASYARCPATRKSRHGALLIHSGGAVDWRSKMQTVVATSSMEAEYIGLCAAVKMATWLKSCMDELSLSRQSRIIIGMDNQSAMIFAEEQIVQDRSKHIDIKFHYTREQIQKGLIGLKYIPTNRLPADALTKPLPKTKLRIYRKEMGIHPVLRPQIQASLTGSVVVQPSLISLTRV